jgi:2-methylaconitate cis-trans-isomerase PrpF
MAKTIPVSIYRGGTSRAVFFHQADLPKKISEQDKLVLDVMGSGHPLQVDGLGGGNPLTSKCAVIGPPSVPDADVDYTFLYPAVERSLVDRKGNCGNISSAVGPFAVNEGLVSATGEHTSVNIHNTNTGALICATFHTKDGKFDPEGDFSIDGVPGAGSSILLEFLGKPGQALLPTGTVKDQLKIAPYGMTLDTTIVQAGNLTVFCKMEDLGIEGEPSSWQSDEELWRKMEAVRSAAAVRLGMVDSPELAKELSPAVPKIVAVGPPAAYTDLMGRDRAPEDSQIRVLGAAMGVMHRAFAITATVATAAACVLPGSVAYEIRAGDGKDILIGHPSGVLPAKASLSQDGGIWVADNVGVKRTARHILRGSVMV